MWKSFPASPSGERSTRKTAPLPWLCRLSQLELIAIIGVGYKLPVSRVQLFLLQRLALETTRYREAEKLAGRSNSECPLDILLENLYSSPRMSTTDEARRVELLQGTLDLLILRTLLFGPSHGHAIAKAIERTSEDVLQVEQGSLYPALHRLIKRGWISAQEGTSENNRRAKYYRLTVRGRKQLDIETSKWDKLVAAIGRILRPKQEASS